MGIFSALLQKTGDIIMRPLDLLNDWAHEPLRRFEHQRALEREEHSIVCRIHAETGRERELNNIEMERMKLEAELEVKRKTEVDKILYEIDSIYKDKQVERMLKFKQAMIEYKEHVVRLDLELASLLGCMHVDLKKKATDLIMDTRARVQQEQEGRRADLEAFFDRMIEKHGDNEKIFSVICNHFDTALAALTSSAQRVEIALEEDIKALSSSLVDMTVRSKNIIDAAASDMERILSLPGQSGPAGDFKQIK